MPRPGLRAAAAFGIIGVALGACSGGSSSPLANATPTFPSPPSSLGPSAVVSPSAARLAHEVTLEPRDVVGFQPAATLPTDSLLGCLLGARAHRLAVATSPAFEQGSGADARRIVAVTQVFATSSRASDSVVSASTQRTRRCLEDPLAAIATAATGVRSGAVTLKELGEQVAVNVDAGAALRATVHAAGGGSSTYVDLRLATVRTAEIVLIDVAAGKPFPAPTAQAILALLVHRARALSYTG